MATQEQTSKDRAASSKRAVEIDDLYRFRLVSDPQLSPDGRMVAYTQTRLRKKKNDYASNIWLVPADGSKEPVKFTGSDKRDMSPRWSPDGSQIAFVSTRAGKPQIWVIPFGGGEARQLTRMKHGVGVLEWSPDGRWIAFTARVKEDDAKQGKKAGETTSSGKPASSQENLEPGTMPTEEMLVPVQAPNDWDDEDEADDHEEEKRKRDHARVVTRLYYKAEGQGFLEGRQHIFIVPAAGGTPRQVTEGDWDAASPRWSPDGKNLAFLANRSPDADMENVLDIIVLPISESGEPGELRQATNHNAAIAGMDWLPSGDGFAVIANDRVQESALGTSMEVWTISLDGEIRKLVANWDGTAVPVVNSDLRSGAGEVRPYFSGDGKAVYFVGTSEGAGQVYSVPLNGGELRTVVDGRRLVFGLSVGAGRLVYAVSSVTLPNDLFTSNPDGSEEKQLTAVNRDVLSTLDLGETREFWLERPGGVKVQGWMLLPPGFTEGEKYPLVLEIHGGPHVSYGCSFFHEFQVLSGRGSIVLYTNPRGSQGYGQAFSDAILNDWGGIDYDDLMACVDYAVGLGFVDEARLGVAGGSYGGYMTTWVIGHTQRFKAAVAMRAVINVYSAWGNADLTWRLWNWEFGGPPQERTQIYLERSPITYAPQMSTPLLLTHSEDDQRVNIEQSEQLFVALKVLRREVKMVRFPSGGHEVSRSGKPSLRIDRLEHIASWFDKYLHGKAEE